MCSDSGWDEPNPNPVFRAVESFGAVVLNYFLFNLNQTGASCFTDALHRRGCLI